MQFSHPLEKSIRTEIIDVLAPPSSADEKQVPYRPAKEEHVTNGAFPTDLSGWSLTNFGTVSSYGMTADAVNFHLAANACRIEFDIPADAEATNRGVRLSRAGVDLTGVERIIMYASHSDVSMEFSVHVTLCSPFEEGFNIEGRTCGESGTLDETWRRCTIDVPEEYRTGNQTVTIEFVSYGPAETNDIVVLIDEISAMGDSIALFEYIPDITEFVIDKIANSFSIETLRTEEQIICVDKSRIENGDFESEIINPWGCYSGDGSSIEISIETSTVKTGNQSLKLVFDEPGAYSVEASIKLDDIDLRDCETITFWVYGGTDSVDYVINVSVGDIPILVGSVVVDEWTQFEFAIPEAYRVDGRYLIIEAYCVDCSGRTVTIYFDDVVTYPAGTSYFLPKTLKEFVELCKSYIDDVISDYFGVPEIDDDEKVLCRSADSGPGAVIEDDMERSDPAPWTCLACSGDYTMSMDTITYHGGAKSLKSLFDGNVLLETRITLQRTSLDFTDCGSIEFWIYGGTNSTTGFHIIVRITDGYYVDLGVIEVSSWKKFSISIPSGNRTTGQSIIIDINNDRADIDDVEVFFDDFVCLEVGTEQSEFEWKTRDEIVTPSEISACGWRGASATEPTSPTEGDIWIDTSGTPVTKVYSGSAWV